MNCYEFKSVSFGCGNAKLVPNSSKLKKDILDKLKNLYRLDIERIKTRIFTDINHPAAYKCMLDGKFSLTYHLKLKPYLLYLTKIQNINQCFYYNTQNGKLIMCTHRFDQKLFKHETVMIGHLLNKKKPNQSTFIVYDIHVDCGKNIVINKNIEERIRKLNEILQDYYIPDKIIDNVNIIPKEYACAEQIKSFVKRYLPTKPELRGNINGIEIIPLDNKYPPILINGEINTPDPSVVEEIDDGINYTPFDTPTPTRLSTTSTPNRTVTSTPIPTSSPKTPTLSPKPPTPSQLSGKYTIMVIRTTSSPDVYDVYTKGQKEKIGFALVQGLGDSSRLKDIFKKTNRKSLRFKCEFNSKFNKWKPIGNPI